jgi:radical SAM protein with 4Fe4S-binding SPASM domain
MYVVLSKLVIRVTHFNDMHCHKWALLLLERRTKLNQLLTNIKSEDFAGVNQLFQEIFFGFSGMQAEPGMAGSLLYHMAMVTKMETETRFLIEELHLASPEIETNLQRFYGDFASDVAELTKDIITISVNANEVAARKNLSTSEKIDLFIKLNQETRTVASMISEKNPKAVNDVEDLFQQWSKQVVAMRLRQEYETIKGLLTLAKSAEILGIQCIGAAMAKVQDRFGQETVNIALEVTLKVGLRREKLQSIMLSDHYINYTMNIDNLDGNMEFLNCPIHGGHNYIGKELGITDEVASLFCTHFCFAHAKAMLETVLPFTFALTQPQRLGPQEKCEFYMKLGHSPKTALLSEKFVPLIISWNVTRKCNLQCSHCYINASTEKHPEEYTDELTTEEAKKLIDQISEVSRPMLILSGGEPLLRKDIFEIIRYGTQKGLKMALGSNGGLIDAGVAKKLKEAGIKTVSISLDSAIPEKHDEFRGVNGSWQKAIDAIKALKENGVLVQVNTTLTQQNYNEIDNIMTLSEKLGVENFHLFFLVPTGRGTKIVDISPAMYESMIKNTFAKTTRHRLNVRPSCAPQFMRVAKDMNLDMRQWIRGCIAGFYYCRIFPNGEVTPCPYLPVKLGNVKEKNFKDIWFNSDIFKTLRNPDALKGKCGACDYKTLCGGCRARAYGLSSDFIDYCGDLHEPSELKGDYLLEDPWCVYQPSKKH